MSPGQTAHHEPNKRRLNTHRLPLRVTDWPAAFKLARIISQRSRGYRVKRFVAGETTAFSRLTTPRDVVTRESERERESDVALPDNEVRFPAITTSWQWNRRIHHSRIIPLGSVITESVESS